MNKKWSPWLLATVAIGSMALAIWGAIPGTWQNLALAFEQPFLANVQAASKLPAEIRSESNHLAEIDPLPVSDSGPKRIAQAGDDSAATSDDELISKGEEVYAEVCAACHQLEGQGAGNYPALAGNSFVTNDDPSGVVGIVMQGRGSMPSFGDQLPPESIAAVASYVRNAWGNEASVVQVADVTGDESGGEDQPQQESADQPAEQAEGQQDEQQESAQQPQEQDTQQQEATAPSAQSSEPMTETAPAGGAAPVRIEIQIIVVTPTPATMQTTETSAGGATSDEAAPEDAAAADTLDEAAPDETTADETTTDEEPTAADIATEEAAAGEATTDEAAPEDTAAGDTTTDEAADDETTADETSADETSADEITATDEVTAGQQTEESPTSVPQIGSALTPSGTLPGEPAIQLVKVTEGLVDPINVAYAPDGSGRVFIVERIGRIRILQDGELLEEPFLDISDAVKIDFLEQGLLGLAFHPDYANNGRFFVYYTDGFTNGDSFLVEYQVSDDPNVTDPSSAKVLLTYDQPYRNHNGGKVAFGPDGYLYWSSGDGGLAGDSFRTSQDLESLLGKLLRIDVDTDSRDGYTIPEDNPFMGQVIPPSQGNEEAQDGDYVPNARPEIWAYGLRNPWQFSFDRETGDLYIADVGQAGWEEINVQPAGSEGGINYGWPILEGSHCFLDENCGTFGELPIAEYANPDDGCSLTGIGVYRGEEFPSLDGIYFSADYCSGRFWGLVRDEQDTWHYAELLHTALVVTGAGEDEAGNLYVTTCTCQFGSNYNPYEDSNGMIWRIVPQDQVPEGAETATLRE